MPKVVLRHLSVIVVDKDWTVLKDASIGVRDGIIEFVCPSNAEPADFIPDQVYDLTGKTAIPGLVNAHTHAGMTLLRGYADDMPLMDWLNERIWPFEANLTPEDVYYGSLTACAEMIRSGTTTFADMYMFESEVAKAASVSGLRASLSRGMTGLTDGWHTALDESLAFCDEWNGRAQGRISTMLAPHAPYTCPPHVLKEIIRAASDLDLRIHTHMSETKAEIDQIREAYGKSPVEYMRDNGLFERPVLAAHCVHVSPSDIEIMRSHGVAVAHNPGSNLKLASGLAPVVAMRRSGIPVALGTDGASSNNNLDMIEEARLAAIIHKGWSYDPTAITAREALTMATIEGARALGLEDRIGSIQPGKYADIVVFSSDRPNMHPSFDITSNIIYSANPGDISMVMVNGQVLLWEGRITTFCEDDALMECDARSKRLAKQAARC